MSILDKHEVVFETSIIVLKCRRLNKGLAIIFNRDNKIVNDPNYCFIPPKSIMTFAYSSATKNYTSRVIKIKSKKYSKVKIEHLLITSSSMVFI